MLLGPIFSPLMVIVEKQTVAQTESPVRGQHLFPQVHFASWMYTAWPGSLLLEVTDLLAACCWVTEVLSDTLISYWEEGIGWLTHRLLWKASGFLNDSWLAEWLSQEWHFWPFIDRLAMCPGIRWFYPILNEQVMNAWGSYMCNQYYSIFNTVWWARISMNHIYELSDIIKLKRKNWNVIFLNRSILSHVTVWPLSNIADF